MNKTNPYASRIRAGTCHLRILETTDLHAHLCAYDYYHDQPSDTVGLVRTATLIRQARAEAENTLLMDNGDLLQGSPLGDVVQETHQDTPHPMIAAMNALAYDAATLGNHDFNFGLEFLDRTIAQAGFPIVLANVRRHGAPEQGFVPPYTLLDREVRDGAGQRHPLCIGVLGLTPPQIALWDRSHLEGRMDTESMVATAQALVPQMRAEGADIVVLLAHTGIAPDSAGLIEENAALPLSRIKGVDVLFVGHTHMVFPSQEFADLPGADLDTGKLNGCATSMAGFWGSHLGVVDLLIERRADGWHLLDSHSEARPIFERDAQAVAVPCVADDPELSALAQPAHLATLRHIRKSIGQTDVALHSYFALVCSSAHLSLIAEAKRDYVTRKLANGPHAHLPVLGAATPFKVGGHGGPDYYTDVPAGDLTIRNVADMYLYPNNMRAVRLNGLQLREWLERSAGMFRQIQPGARDAPLLDPDMPCYYFDMLGGVSYQFDLSQPSRYDAQGRLIHPMSHRVQDLALNGVPVTPKMEFIVATNSYRLDGGGAFPGAMDGEPVLDTPDSNRNVVLDYIRSKGDIAPRAGQDWRLAPIPGATVLFQTGPRARLYMQDLEGMQVDDLGIGPDGFVTYRLHL